MGHTQVLGIGDKIMFQNAMETALLNTNGGQGIAPPGQGSSLVSIQVTGIPANRYIYSHLRNAGSPDMRVNGSVTPVNFDLQINALWYLYQLNVIISDAGMTALKFGGIAALTNGVRIQILASDETLIIDLHESTGIKMNIDWFDLASIGSVIQDFPTSDIFKVGIPLERGGVPMELKADSIIRFIIQDDLTALDYFEVIANGIYA